MNKLRAKTGYKMALVAMLIFSIIVSLISTVGVIWMSNESYYSLDWDLDTNHYRFGLADVNFEQTSSVRSIFQTACFTLSESVSAKIVSSGDAMPQDSSVLLTRELEGGDKIVLKKDWEKLSDIGDYGSYTFDWLSLAISDEAGNVLYQNGPAVNETAYTAFLQMGFNSRGELDTCYSSGSNGYMTTVYIRHYITCDELTSYAAAMCEHLWNTFYSDVSASDIDDSTPYSYNENDIAPSDYYHNAAYLVVAESGNTVTVADAMKVLQDYAYYMNTDGYYYGFDESVGKYYLSLPQSEMVTPVAVVSFTASLLGEESYTGELARLHLAYELFYPRRVTVIVIGLLAAAAAVAALIMLLFAAGWSKDSDTPQQRPIDKLPLELHMLLSALAIGAAVIIFDDASDSRGRLRYLTIMIICALAILTLVLMFLMSLARRVKTGTLLRNTLCYRALKYLSRLLSKFPVVWKTVLLCAAYAILSLFCIISMNSVAIVLWAIISLALFTAVCVFDFQFNLISRMTAKIAAGEAGDRVDSEKFFPRLKRHANSINSINDSVAAAVDEKMKSERMKTDLIANVSHDVKTPLTSIINYIDLLKSTNITDPTAIEYIAVLERQSVRLKRLLQDIVEASKASSGCINAALAPIDLRELLEQARAEYSERLEGSGVITVMSVDEDCGCVIADGRLLWRVFDNLLSNICKYSQPGTRAYIKAQRHDSSVEISFRNISAEALDIPVDTLMERFVRGDRSRCTDGSGLGLSIAQSLIELQNGRLSLSIDGDLFRAAVTLPACDLLQETDVQPDTDEVVLEQPDELHELPENDDTQPECDDEK